MSINSCNSRPVLRFGYRLLSATLLAVGLQAASFTAGAPGAPAPGGTLNFDLTNGGVTIHLPAINVPATTKGHPTTDAEKAELVFKAFAKANVPNLGYIGGNTVTAPDTTIKQTGDTTGEKSKIADLGLSLPGSPAYASLGFDGPLIATGFDGSESVFTASFGVDDSIFASASLTYDELSSPTADGLATGLYFELLANLSPNLQSDLSLDLSTDTITFDFAPGSGSYFVETLSTSPGTSPFMTVGGVSAVPEPVTFLSLGTGLILIGTKLRKKARGMIAR
jgi:hypothetical protein